MYEKKGVHLRLPTELHAEAQAAAQASELSVNEWYVRAIRYALAAKNGGSHTTTHTDTLRLT